MTRAFFALLALCGVSGFTGCGNKTAAQPLAITSDAPRVVDAGCGRCLFNRKEDKKCNLAIRVEGKSYFVDGFSIGQFGNPDIAGGMCKRVQQARVVGEVANNRFAATAFELVP